MAVSPVNSKAYYHARSISLPSRPHPLIPEFEEHLCRLRASEAASSSSSISLKLSGLTDLHDCVDNLLLLPFTQQTLAQCRHEQWVDELLDGSLRLLDICGMAKDALLQTREGAQELQSSMRRKRGGRENGISSEIEKYLTSRKKVKKAIHKALRSLKGMKNKCRFAALNKDPETLSMVTMLREVETITLTVLEALLSSITGATAGSKQRGWSLVSKLMQHNRVACDEAEAEQSEFEKVNNTLCTLLGNKNKSVNVVHVDKVHNEVSKLESSIQDLEEGIEFLSRRLIKTRVSLLNILSH